MTVVAIIAGATVREVFTLPAGFTVAECIHADLLGSCVDVTAVTPQPQQGWSYAGGVFTAPPPPPAPTPAQEAAAMLAAGMCVVASTATPAISGTYAIDPLSRATLAEIVAGINAGDGLPGGGASFIYDDNGGEHMFTAVGTVTAEAQVLVVGKGLRDFVYAASQVIQNRSTVIPAQPWPIP